MNQNISEKKLQLEKEIEVAQGKLIYNIENYSLTKYLNPRLRQIPATIGIISSLSYLLTSESDKGHSLTLESDNTTDKFSSFLKIIPDLMNIIK